MTRAASARRGVTLIELLVVLAILAIVASVSGLAVPRITPPTARDSIDAQIEQARRSAISTRTAVTVTLRTVVGAASLTALPDGQVVADAALGVDRLTGAIDTTRLLDRRSQR